jgi:hypothetical protein
MKSLITTQFEMKRVWLFAVVAIALDAIMFLRPGRYNKDYNISIFGVRGIILNIHFYRMQTPRVGI